MSKVPEASFSQELTNNVLCCVCKMQFHILDFDHLPRSRAPILLECLHSVCVSCAVKKPVKCRFCLTHSVINNADYNMYLMGHIVASKTQVQGISSKECNAPVPEPDIRRCCECNKAAQSACRQCSNIFCKSCWSHVHDHAKILRTHEKTDLDSFYAIGADTCTTHKQPVQFFCETCDIALCVICLQSNHVDHQTKLLSLHNASLLKDISSAFEEADSHLYKIENMLKFVRMKRASRKPDASTTIKRDIVNYFQQLHGYLQIQERAALKTLNETSSLDFETLNGFEMILLGIIKEAATTREEANMFLRSVDKQSERICGTRILKALKKIPTQSYMFVENSAFVSSEPKVELKKDVLKALENLVTFPVANGSHYELLAPNQLQEHHKLIEEVNDMEDVQPKNSGSSRTSSISEGSSTASSESPTLFKMKSLVLYEVLEVEMAHINSWESFYVYLTENRKTFSDLQFLVQAAASKSQPPRDIYPRMRLFARHNDRWYRATVINGDGDLAVVNLCDYGLKVMLPRHDLRCLKGFKYDPFVIHCSMYKLPKPSEADTNFFKSIFLLKPIKLKIRVAKENGNPWKVNILLNLNDQFGSETINLRDYLIKSPNTLSEVYFLNDPTMEYSVADVNELKNVEKVRVSSAFLPCSFHVQKIESCVIVKEMSNKMAEIYGGPDKLRSEILVPRQGFPCAVFLKKKNMWCRGLIVRSKNQYVVQCIDVGNRVKYEFGYCRRLHAQFLNQPPLAYSASLAYVDSFVPHDKFQETVDTTFSLLYGQVVRIGFVSTTKGSANLNVELPNGSDCRTEMVKRGIIKTVESTVTTPTPLLFGDVEAVLETLPEHEADLLNSVETASLEDYSADTQLLTEQIEQQENDLPNMSSKGIAVEVTLVKVVSPDLIYFSWADYKNRLDEVSAKLGDCWISTLADGLTTWKLEQPVSFFLRTTRKWYRGKITVLIDEDDLYKVFADDLVETYEVHATNIRPYMDVEIPKLAIKCFLDGIRPAGSKGNWSAESTDQLGKIIGVGEKFYVKKLSQTAGGSLPIELFFKETVFLGPLIPAKVRYQSVNEMLCSKNLAVRLPGYELGVFELFCPNGRSDIVEVNSNTCKEDNTEEVVEKLEEKEECEDEDLQKARSLISVPSAEAIFKPAEPLKRTSIHAKVTYIDHRGVIYFHDDLNEKMQRNELNSNLQLIYNNQPQCADSVQWSVGECCTARFHMDNCWYRARIIMIGQTANEDLSFLVEFVDYGNTETCSKEDLRKGAIIHVPILCHTCYLADFELNLTNARALDGFHSNVVGDTWELTKIGNTSEPFAVLLSCLEENVDVCEGLVKRKVLRRRKKRLDVPNFPDRDYKFDFDGDERWEDRSLNSEHNEPGNTALTDIFSECKSENSSHYSHLMEAQLQYNKSVWKNERISDDLADMRKITVNLTVAMDDILYGRLVMSYGLPNNVQKWMEKFEDFNKEIKDEAKELPKLLAVAVNVICIAQSAGSIYRVVIAGIGDGVVEAQLIDYGGVSNFTNDQLYVCKEKWTEFPAMAVALKTPSGKTAWPAQIYKMLNTNDAVVADIFDIDNGFILAKLRL